MGGIIVGISKDLVVRGRCYSYRILRDLGKGVIR